MKIWLINHYAVPIKYYPLARTTNFAKYLMKIGHDVIIFSASAVHNSEINLISDNKQYKEEVVDSVHYVYIKTSQYLSNGLDRIQNMFQFSRRLPKVCNHFDAPNVIVASSSTPQACMSGLKLSKKYNCRGIAEISDLWPESFIAYGLIAEKNPFLKILYAYEKKMYEKADQLVFTMEGGKQYIIDKGWDKEHGGSIDTNKVHHINNGIVLDDFEYNKNHYQIDDPDLKCSDFFKAVYIGSIRKVNHLGMLVDVAKKLKTDGYNKIQILVYGDGNEKEMLEKRCIDEGIDNLIFKGSVDKKYIPYLLNQCDLNLMHGGTMNLGHYGISPNKSFDYLASGKPILSDITCNYDYIEKNNAGLTVENSIDAIEEGLIQFSLLAKDHYQEMCKNAKETAKQYDFSVLTEKLIEIIES